MNKLLTFAIPCYNSAAYMDACVQSILDGTHAASDIEIIIVDDGSFKDDTAQKGDAWQEQYPEIIQCVHQENGGHGTAVLTGLGAAHGTFFKVVDSDDWLDKAACERFVEEIRKSEDAGEEVDLFISNYVYEHSVDNTQHVVGYAHVLPEGRVFGWGDIGHFLMSQNLLMHSLCYRTQRLRDGGVPMPPHTFYVDNIYAWVPLPRCKKLRYVNTDLYRYFIGREDQSVNEQVMAGRIDQQVRITRIMMESYHLYEDIKIAQLRSYMVNYFVIMMAICSVFSRLSDHENAMAELNRLWLDLHAYDRRLWRRCRLGVVGLGTNLPGKMGEQTTLFLYRIAGKLVKFN